MAETGSNGAAKQFYEPIILNLPETRKEKTTTAEKHDRSSMKKKHEDEVSKRTKSKPNRIQTNICCAPCSIEFANTLLLY